MKNAAYFFTNGQSVRSGNKKPARTYLMIENKEVKMFVTPRIAKLDVEKTLPRASQGRSFEQGLFAPVIIDNEVSFFTSTRMVQDKYGGVAYTGVIDDSILNSFPIAQIKYLYQNDDICYETKDGKVILPDEENGMKLVTKREGLDPDRYEKLASLILDLTRKKYDINPEAFIIKNDEGKYELDEEYISIYENVVERNLSTKTVPVNVIGLKEIKGEELEGEALKLASKQLVMDPLKSKIQETINEQNKNNIKR